MLVTLEGIDGAGTTTQLDLISKQLNDKGFNVITTAEPSTGVIGQILRCILQKNIEIDNNLLALLFAGDRIDHNNNLILPFLKNLNSIVICDRYIESSIAYQGINCGLDWIAQINNKVKQADLILFFDITVEESKKRRLSRGLSSELLEKDVIQTKALDNYRQLCKNSNIVRIDALQSIESVTHNCVKSILEKMSQQQNNY